MPPTAHRPRRARGRRWQRLAAGLGTLAGLLGCGAPGEDVRVGYCKQLLSVQLRGVGLDARGLRWVSTDADPRGYQHLYVGLRLEAPAADGQMTPAHAVCYYDYDAVDDTAASLADPLSAYSTSPSRMTLNGRELSRAELTRAKRDVLAEQGRALLDNAR